MAPSLALAFIRIASAPTFECFAVKGDDAGSDGRIYKDEVCTGCAHLPTPALPPSSAEAVPEPATTQGNSINSHIGTAAFKTTDAFLCMISRIESEADIARKSHLQYAS